MWPSNHKNILITNEFHHSSGLTNIIASLISGSTIVFTNKSDADSYLRIIQKHQINIIHLIPTTLNYIVKYPQFENYDVSSVEFIGCVSTPLDEKLLEIAKKRFPKLRAINQFYSMTEVGCVCTDFLAPKGPKVGSVGPLTSGVTIKIEDLKTQEILGANSCGEICVKAPYMMKGYIDMAQDCFDAEGFMRTGDIGYYDKDGYIFIVERLKDLIKYRGFSVAPAEIETVLRQHPAVLEACVVGIPHSELVETPVAFVVLQDKVEEMELMEWVNDQMTIAPLFGVRFLAEIPRNTGNKFDRIALRNMF